MRQAFVREQVYQVVSRDVPRKVDDDLLLVRSHQLVFKLAKDLEKFEIEGLLTGLEARLLCGDNDLPQDFVTVKSQELLVVAE
jgi:hypothetical protein